MKTIQYKLLLPLPLLLPLLLLLPLVSIAQTMRWIPAPQGFSTCPDQQGTKEKTLSYVLEYTPKVSGVLTSYTTGFLVSCTSAGSAVVKNQSRSMTSKSREISGCNTMGAVLMNSSGNSGESVHNTIQAGVSVILHQVCFSIPAGEAITIQEETVTDLTTSIDLGNGQFITEFPSFESITVGKPRYDQDRPMLLLDFKGIPAGPFIAQLDWSTSMVVNTPHFVIERSVDGIVFAPIGTVEAGEKSGQISTFQFFDKEAVEGDNHYRLLQVNAEGINEYSPTRIVHFSPQTLSVTYSPNPANDYLQVNIKSPVALKNIKLVDANGRIVMDEKDDNKNVNVRLDVKKLTGGIYTLVVETADEKYSDKVVIAH